MDEQAAKAAHEQKMFEQREDHLGHLPGHILFDLARNEAAPREWRKAAVELLIDKNYPQAKHPDLALLVLEIKNERTARGEVEAVVESAIEGEISHYTGPFKASFTTRSLVGGDEIDN